MRPAAQAEAAPAPRPPSMSLLGLRAALRTFQSSGKAFELIHTSSAAASSPRRCRTLVVLDSSFNPPTIAHMRMATTALQDLQRQRHIAATLQGGSAPHEDSIRLLLLLAVNNADKAPKPASFEHRLLMMQAFAGDIHRAWRESQHAQTHQHEQQAARIESQGELLVDIGLTTHPYFHDKSSAIAAAPEYDFSPSRPCPASSPETPATEQVFLAGFDTLIRIFNPKYYTPPVPEQGVTVGGQGHEVKTQMQACLDPFLARARLRITMRTDAEWGGREEQAGYVERLLRGDELEKVGGRKEWARRVEMVEGMDGREDGLVLSSTEARAAVEKRDWDRLKRLVPEEVAGLIERGEVSW